MYLPFYLLLLSSSEDAGANEPSEVLGGGGGRRARGGSVLGMMQAQDVESRNQAAVGIVIATIALLEGLD